MLARATSRRSLAVAIVAIAAAGIPVFAQLRPNTPSIDGFGYSVYDQDDAECGFAFADIAATGTPVTFTAAGAAPGDDDGGAVIALTLAFELYGQPVTSVVMSSNGYLAAAASLASESGGDFSNDPLPAVPDQPPAVPGRIMAYHDDLSGFDTAGTARYEHFGVCPRPSESLGTEPCTVIQWTGWSFPGGGDPFDLQAVLYHDTFEVAVQIRPGSGALDGGTIGVQDRTATHGVEYHPEGPLTADTAVCIFEPRFPPGGPSADLEVSKNDKLDAVTPGEEVLYEIGVLNRGPSPVTGAPVSDVVPAALVGCAWTCVSSEGSLCAPSGTGDIDDPVDLLPGGWADYVLVCNAAATPAPVENTVTAVPPTPVTDPVLSNNAATDLDPAGSGRVPDGAFLPGPAVLEIERFGSDLVLSWGPSCLTSDSDYEVYEGTLGGFYDHGPIACTTGGALGLTHPVPAGNTYYLVVPTNLLTEGSYGLDSAGDERPQGTSWCAPQAVGACP
jgi:uncharacterized repeat protein (TIGR01451 family)